MFQGENVPSHTSVVMTAPPTLNTKPHSKASHLTSQHIRKQRRVWPKLHNSYQSFFSLVPPEQVHMVTAMDGTKRCLLTAHFPCRSMSESYKFSCEKADFFVKINRKFSCADLFEGEASSLQVRACLSMLACVFYVATNTHMNGFLFSCVFSHMQIQTPIACIR
jgi:hypothetical protein